LRVLAKLKWLRGSKLDPFGRSADRRLERELLARYEACLDRVADELDDSRFELALELLRLPDQVRGYGPIKSAAAARARARELELLQQWAAPVLRSSQPRASAA
jgi:indolepyruvate ferredoxin oxidoreductase